MIRFRLILVGLLGGLLLGCTDPNVVYNGFEELPDGLWYTNHMPTFKVEIDDTTQRYRISYLLRNAHQYPYYNLYLERKVTTPDSTIMAARLEEVYLSDPTTGKPRGQGLGDLFDHTIVIERSYRFHKPGTYTFSVGQAMRQNPLPFVLSIGFRVEKVVASEETR